jgi:hypothetical protein
MHEANRFLNQLVMHSSNRTNESSPTMIRMTNGSNENNTARHSRAQSRIYQKCTEKQQTQSIRWPTIGEFTGESIGCEKITEYIEQVMQYLMASVRQYEIKYDSAMLLVSLLSTCSPVNSIDCR